MTDPQITSAPGAGDWVIFAVVTVVILTVVPYYTARWMHPEYSQGKAYTCLAIMGAAAITPWLILGLLA